MAWNILIADRPVAQPMFITPSAGGLTATGASGNAVTGLVPVTAAVSLQGATPRLDTQINLAVAVALTTSGASPASMVARNVSPASAQQMLITPTRPMLGLKLAPNASGLVLPGNAPIITRGGSGTGTPAYFQNFDAKTVGTAAGMNSYDVTVDNVHAFSAPNSGKSTVASGGFTFGAAQILSNVLPGEGDEVWFRIRTFIPTGFNLFSNPHLKWMRIDTGSVASGGHGAHIDWYITAVDSTHLAGYFNFIYEGVQSWLFASDTTLPTGLVFNQWQTWEAYYKLSATASVSILRLWRDGTLICDTSANIPAGVQRRATLTSGAVIGNLQGNQAQGFMWVTYWNGGAPASQSAWVDDFTIYTSLTGRPTALDAAGNTFIGTS